MNPLLIFLFVIIVMTDANHLTNTIWTYQVSKTCIDTLKFGTNQKVIEYNYEVNYTFRGSYKIFKDTLFVIVRDNSHSEDHGKVTYYTDKYLTKNNTLCFVGNRKLVNGKWKDEKAKTDLSFSYHKVQ